VTRVDADEFGAGEEFDSLLAPSWFWCRFDKSKSPAFVYEEDVEVPRDVDSVGVATRTVEYSERQGIEVEWWFVGPEYPQDRIRFRVEEDDLAKALAFLREEVRVQVEAEDGSS
jgi:hypothetical protein